MRKQREEKKFSKFYEHGNKYFIQELKWICWCLSPFLQSESIGGVSGFQSKRNICDTANSHIASFLCESENEVSGN